MAWDPKPSSWIASWSEDGTNITIPIASLSQLTAGEADGTTGDSRECIMALMERTYAWYEAIADADRPACLQVSRAIADNNDGTIWLTYVIRVKCDLAGLTMSVTAES